MPNATRSHSGNDLQNSGSISRSSSISVVSPAVRNGVGEIVARLTEIDDIVESIKPESLGYSPDIDELRQCVAKLQAEVKDVRLAQNAKIDEIKNGVKNNIKGEIAQIFEGEISAIIAGSIAECVSHQMATWARESDAARLTTGLECTLESNNSILTVAKIQLENSRARMENSTLDVLDDFNTRIAVVKGENGRVSEVFPTSFRQLFSYDAAKLLQLLRDYDLHPLEKPAENLNRFLIFIGMNVSIPDQLVEHLEEQLPTYPQVRIPGSLTENDRKSTRRQSASSEKSPNNLWSGLGLFS